MPIVAPEKSAFPRKSQDFNPPPPPPALVELAILPASRSVEFAGWLPEVLKLAREGHMEDAVDKLFDEVDQWLREGCFDRCNQLLAFPADLFPLKLSVSLLALTQPAAGKLNARKSFLDGVVALIEAEGRDSEKVLGRLRR